MEPLPRWFRDFRRRYPQISAAADAPGEAVGARREDIRHAALQNARRSGMAAGRRP
ncbi:MAG: hypothetical protein H6Q33_3773 [Deltaproteobacteria bacterium]|nr:hypothetical protein [Deltaproteobacteria bacterium]